MTNDKVNIDAQKAHNAVKISCFSREVNLISLPGRKLR